MNSRRDSQTALVGRFATLQQAQIAAGMLEANGIPSQVTNATLVSVLPMTDTWAPINLLVPASRAPQARELLRTHGDTAE